MFGWQPLSLQARCNSKTTSQIQDVFVIQRHDRAILLNFKQLYKGCVAANAQKQEFSGDILQALDVLKKEGGLEKWGSVKPPDRVNVFQGELKKVGVKNTGAIATPTIRNERAFLITVVGVTSVLATAAGFLPGDWVRSCRLIPQWTSQMPLQVYFSPPFMFQLPSGTGPLCRFDFFNAINYKGKPTSESID